MKKLLCSALFLLTFSEAQAACEGNPCLNGIMRVCHILPSGDGVWINKTPFERCVVQTPPTQSPRVAPQQPQQQKGLRINEPPSPSPSGMAYLFQLDNRSSYTVSLTINGAAEAKCRNVRPGGHCLIELRVGTHHLVARSTEGFVTQTRMVFNKPDIWTIINR